MFSFALVAFRVAQRWWIEWNVMLGKDQKYTEKVKDPDVESGFVKNVQDEKADKEGGASCR